jgi:hypothetical protein
LCADEVDKKKKKTKNERTAEEEIEHNRKVAVKKIADIKLQLSILDQKRPADYVSGGIKFR